MTDVKLPEIAPGNAMAGSFTAVKLTEGCARRAVTSVLALAFALVVAAVAMASVPIDQAQAASATKTAVRVGTKAYTMKLAGTDAAAAFRSYLSKTRTLKMKELNGNEKYRYLSKSFPKSPKRYKKVRAGDVMLYGDDCLVIFYKTHKTSYKYTKIGRLTSTKGLAKAAGRKSVKVRFSKMKQVKKSTATPSKLSGVDAPGSSTSAPADPAAKPGTGDSSEPSASTDSPSTPSEDGGLAAAQGLAMTVNGQAVEVEWEDNGSVAALAQMARSAPVEIQMSGYGGFEQVGEIGASLPRDDVQTTTAPGDIVLYAGDKLVLFHGSNTWAYTRLGKITGKTDAELKSLLGGDSVTVTVAWRESATKLTVPSTSSRA